MDKKEQLLLGDPRLAEMMKKINDQLAELSSVIKVPDLAGLEEIQKALQSATIALAPLKKAQEEFSQALKIPYLSDEERKRIHQIAKAWAAYGLCPPIGNEMIDEQIPPHSEEEVVTLYQHFLKEERPETYCRDYLNQNEGVAYEYAKEAVEDYKRGAYRSCAAMLFALLDGELLRHEKRSELPKNKRKYRLLPGAEFYKENVRNKKGQDFYLTFIMPQCFFLTVNYYYQNAADFQDPSTHLVGLRPCLDHGMLVQIDGLTCFKIFTLVAYCDYSLRWALRSEDERKK